ncbi:hypothetical protein GCM10025331_59370 [Actinoplanes utahensis]|nr:hypothetical protein Aut01nite_69930 [Actinoplanes utahensis]
MAAGGEADAQTLDRFVNEWFVAPRLSGIRGDGPRVCPQPCQVPALFVRFFLGSGHRLVNPVPVHPFMAL